MAKWNWSGMCACAVAFRHKIVHFSRSIRDSGKYLKFLGFLKWFVFQGFFLLAEWNWSWGCECAVAFNIKLPILWEILDILKNGWNFWFFKGGFTLSLFSIGWIIFKWGCACAAASNIKSPKSRKPLEISKNGWKIDIFWRGLYFKGSFYWLNEMGVGVLMRSTFKHKIS